jgi:hypothetical protein
MATPVTDAASSARPGDEYRPVRPPSEASLIGRFVAIFTPVFAIAAGWFAGVIAHAVPGAHLNQAQIVTFMTAAAASVVTAGWKWLQGWQQHEARVAQGTEAPVRPTSPR